jgi:hypothetical protein
VDEHCDHANHAGPIVAKALYSQHRDPGDFCVSLAASPIAADPWLAYRIKFTRRLATVAPSRQYRSKSVRGGEA